jgi:hypothetical protein
VCFRARGVEVLEDSLQEGNARLPNFLITLLCCSVSFMLVVVVLL